MSYFRQTWTLFLKKSSFIYRDWWLCYQSYQSHKFEKQENLIVEKNILKAESITKYSHLTLTTGFRRYSFSQICVEPIAVVPCLPLNQSVADYLFTSLVKFLASRDHQSSTFWNWRLKYLSWRNIGHNICVLYILKIILLRCQQFHFH